MDENDLSLDEDLFLTKLALQILEGRSFDITGTKGEVFYWGLSRFTCSKNNFLVPFDQLFPKSEPIEINHLPEDDQDGSSLASSSTEREPPKDFVTDMVQKIEMEYQRLLKVEKQRVERFRLNNRDNQCPQGKNVNYSSREL